MLLFRFAEEHIREILAIYALKFSVYANRRKHSIEGIREELKEFDYNDKGRIEAMTDNIKQYLNQVNRAQIKSLAALYHLCAQVETNQFVDKI